MSNIKVFYIERTNKCQISLRRFVLSDGQCPLPHGYHDADVIIENETEMKDSISNGDVHDHADPRWPKKCGCGYEFTDKDEWQWNSHTLYVNKETGLKYTLHDLPVGAMYDADWMPDSYKGLDGLSLHVKTPGGMWNIDSVASNCTKPGDKSHRCWCRHGVPPNITVDKNGNTCGAGAGSIMCGSYHGFLRDGFLVDA